MKMFAAKKMEGGVGAAAPAPPPFDNTCMIEGNKTATKTTKQTMKQRAGGGFFLLLEQTNALFNDSVMKNND